MSGVAPIPEPSRRLGSSARAYWTVGALAGAIPGAVVAVVAGRALSGAGSLGGAAGPLGTLVTAAGILACVVAVAVVPQLRWRTWRYEVRDEELDLRHGAWRVVRTLVPVVRIQHVETERTVFSQAFGLATVRVHTAAGATTIPALGEAEAASIRDRIAGLARVPDEL